MAEERQEVITFKVPESMKKAMDGIHNRSEFIRNALLMALDNLCPLCKGSGILLPNQRNHWEEFAKSHDLQKCEHCSALHLVCKREPHGHVHDSTDTSGS